MSQSSNEIDFMGKREAYRNVTYLICVTATVSRWNTKVHGYILTIRIKHSSACLRVPAGTLPTVCDRWRFRKNTEVPGRGPTLLCVRTFLPAKPQHLLLLLCQVLTEAVASFEGRPFGGLVHRLTFLTNTEHQSTLKPRIRSDVCYLVPF